MTILLSSSVQDIPTGSLCVLDTNLLLYAEQGVSVEARQALRRCSAGELVGVSPSVVWEELAHRLMVAEAVASGEISGPNPARKLAERPDLVRRLFAHRARLRELAATGLRYVAVTREDVVQGALDLQARLGLLTNDSIIAACAIRIGADCLLTFDAAFAAVTETRVVVLHDG